MKGQDRIGKLPLASLLLATWVLALPVATPAQADVKSISPSEDSYVVQNDPTANFGAATVLRVKSFLLSTDTGEKFPTSYATGTTGNAASYPQGALVDDVTAGSTGTLGVNVTGFRSAQPGHDYATLPLSPNAAGAYQAWSPFGSGSAHYDRISDGDDTTGVQVTGSTALMETEQLADSTRTEPITSVTVYIRANATGSGAGEKAAILWRTHGADYSSVISGSLSRGSFSEYSDSKTKNPNTGNDWTWDEINALEVGVRADTLGDGETLQVSELWVVVNMPYNPDSEIYRDLSFGIPADAVTIKGIEVVVSAYREGAVEGGTFGVRLSGNGGANWTDFKGTSPLTLTDALYTLGSSSDLWGTSWSADSFTNGNFRLEVAPEGGKAIPIAHDGYQWLLDSVRVKVYYEQNQNERSFLQFDLSSIPDGATITGAEMKMTIKTPPSASRDYQAYHISDDTWTETGINWGNQPAENSLLDTLATGTTAETLVIWSGDDLKNTVNSERFGGDSSLSVRVNDATEDDATGYVTEFYSREEAEATKRPVLVVTYTLPSPDPEFYFSAWRPPVNLFLGDESWDGWESGSTMPVKFLVVDKDGNPVAAGVDVMVQIGASASVAAVLDDAGKGQWKAEIKLVGSGSQSVTITGNVQDVPPLVILVKQEGSS